MRLKSDTVPGSKTQSWLRLCRKIKDNPRFITAPFRETKAFEKLYNQRTSVERTFGDLKDNYNLDNIRVDKNGKGKSLYGFILYCPYCIKTIRCSQQGKNHKNSTNLSFQKFLWEKRNINQKPTKLNQKPCRILSKTANHLSILKILIEIFKIPARNAPRILIYYMEKWTHQQKQREKFRKNEKFQKKDKKEVLWKI